MRRHVLRWLQIGTALVGAVLLYRVLRQHDLHEIAAAIAKIPALNVVMAVLCTAGSYVCLAVIEYMGILYACRRRLAPARVMLVTLAGLGIGHSVGLAALSSGAVRYRMYTRNGLGAEAVAKILIFSGLTVIVGLLATFCIVAVSHGAAIGAFLHLPPAGLRLMVAALVALGGAYLAVCATRRAQLRIGPIRLRLPSLFLALGQLVVGVLNIAFMAGALYACLAPLTHTDYALVAALIVLSDTAAILGHVPGGWGVLEYVVSSFVAGADVVAALVVFRAVYYLGPLALGVAILIADEFASRDKRIGVGAGDGAIQRG